MPSPGKIENSDINTPMIELIVQITVDQLRAEMPDRMLDQSFS